ncbi:DUF1318 domain-containing protein [Paraglaciecola aquimarina]|uniref:DUF1318 domain-containing protein n=1 Tax=Paraglaciecola aquimarina TaxID=1235557 RepID=A0ABU3ST74_9ALTE|nr:DUF1318 domain-containing protein [Paraglaciecola aquimarina]MDU0353182.1 DUF1318 domain-containing protein [Paraglaciecola aquimarina]
MNENTLKLTTVLAAIGLSFSVWAMNLDEAKNQGLVGENSTGYLGLVVQNNAAKALISEVNEKRKAQYLKLAQVEALAAAKAIKKTKAGHYIEVNGQWVKK